MEEMQELRKARTILNSYNFMGYQALGLGPTDLQLGVETLQDLEKEARFPFLCANLVDKATKKPLFRPCIVVEVSGLRIGLYSVMMSEMNETYSKRVIPNAELLELRPPRRGPARASPRGPGRGLGAGRQRPASPGTARRRLSACVPPGSRTGETASDLEGGRG